MIAPKLLTGADLFGVTLFAHMYQSNILFDNNAIEKVEQFKYLGKMDLEEVGRGCGDWMELAEDRDRWRALVSTVMNLRVP